MNLVRQTSNEIIAIFNCVIATDACSRKVVTRLTRSWLWGAEGGSGAADAAGRPSHNSLLEVLVSGRKLALELGPSSARFGSAIVSTDMIRAAVSHLLPPTL